MPVDVGQVGDVVAVDPSPVQALLDAGRIPVIATVARGGDGLSYNVNADTAAAAIAVALAAEKLIMLTDVEGFYADWPTTGEVVSSIRVGRAQRTASHAGHGDGARRWRRAYAPSRAGSPRRTFSTDASRMRLLLEVFTTEGIGTMVLPAKEPE